MYTHKEREREREREREACVCKLARFREKVNDFRIAHERHSPRVCGGDRARLLSKLYCYMGLIWPIRHRELHARSLLLIFIIMMIIIDETHTHTHTHARTHGLKMVYRDSPYSISPCRIVIRGERVQETRCKSSESSVS